MEELLKVAGLLAYVIGAVWYLRWLYVRIFIPTAEYLRIDVAKSLYGDGWYGAVKECNDAHYPGDCPLCGSEEAE